MREQKSSDEVAGLRILQYLCNNNQKRARNVAKKALRRILNPNYIYI
jgi:hypothetical protein